MFQEVWEKTSDMRQVDDVCAIKKFVSVTECITGRNRGVNADDSMHGFSGFRS